MITTDSNSNLIADLEYTGQLSLKTYLDAHYNNTKGAQTDRTIIMKRTNFTTDSAYEQFINNMKQVHPSISDNDTHFISQ